MITSAMWELIFFILGMVMGGGIVLLITGICEYRRCDDE